MTSAANKMSVYRQRLRHQGLRPVQRWVPDLRDPRIVAEVRQSVLALKKTAGDEGIEPLLDQALADIEGWE